MGRVDARRIHKIVRQLRPPSLIWTAAARSRQMSGDFSNLAFQVPALLWRIDIPVPFWEFFFDETPLFPPISLDLTGRIRTMETGSQRSRPDQRLPDL